MFETQCLMEAILNRTSIKYDLSKLKDEDTINILLYGIYKLTDNPEYSAISELIYTLDKDNLFKLCSVFGGCTIKIPTMEDLKTMLNVLMVYDKVNNQGKSFTQACALLGIDTLDLKDVKIMYDILSDILMGYNNGRE